MLNPVYVDAVDHDIEIPLATTLPLTTASCDDFDTKRLWLKKESSEDG